MEKANLSSVTSFIILGLSSRPDLEIMLFIFFTIVYSIALVGNLVILILAIVDPGLKTPMYFFLGLLSFLDICCTSATVPKMLINFLSVDKSISYKGCVIQLFFFTWAMGIELLLLTVMAFDRYIAIGNPLRYCTIMNRKICVQITIVIWILGSINSTAHTYCTFQLPYCDDNRINHFFCEIMPLLNIACGDTYVNEIVVFTADVILGMVCFTLTCISYIFIISTILKIRSAEGKRKAFSTCAAHICIVSVYYGAVIFTYIRPRSSLNLDKDKIVSALYAVITPSLNPVIYSLRNKEVKEAVKRILKKLMPNRIK
uniref:Olfactory receptor n=1 Tax=Geotrypetes seraphini TaxID=260995 RepID=A0A6P8P641_GEOSA|nr:olfactory receptor 5V1-like [Geotrypetes seraphini]